MTAVTPETVEHATEPRTAALARRLAELLVRIRAVAGDDLQTTIARSVDEAFAAIARDFRS